MICPEQNGAQVSSCLPERTTRSSAPALADTQLCLCMIAELDGEGDLRDYWVHEH